MKKILLFLLIFTLCLVGCQTAETPPENNETPNGDQTENQPSNPNNDTNDTQTPSDPSNDTNDTQQPSDSNGDTDDTQKPPSSTIIYPTTTPEEKKPPLVPITNKDDPQDENAKFLYIFNLKYGEFVRGGTITLEVKSINNMETTYTWFGSSSAFSPFVQLYIVVNGEEYKIGPKYFALSDDSGYHDIEPGESRTRTYQLTIPEDAPLGEYTLRCIPLSAITEGEVVEFDGYFTLE